MRSYYTGYGMTDRPTPKDILGAIFGTILIIVLSAIVSSCRVQSFTQHHENDSVRVKYKHDSIYIWKYDSVFVSEKQRHDTIFVESRKWSIRYKDKIVEVHDTIRTTETETIVQPQPYVPDYNKNCTRGFWVLLAILILIIGGWSLRKYLKLRSGGLIK